MVDQGLHGTLKANLTGCIDLINSLNTSKIIYFIAAAVLKYILHIISSMNWNSSGIEWENTLKYGVASNGKIELNRAFIWK